MEIDVFFVWEKLLAKQLYIAHIPTLYQWSNILIKALPPTRFALRCAKLNVKNFLLENYSP